MAPWVFSQRSKRLDDSVLWDDDTAPRSPSKRRKEKQEADAMRRMHGDTDDDVSSRPSASVNLTRTRTYQLDDATRGELEQEQGLGFDNRKRWYSIDPYSTFRGRWDLTQACILVYIALVVPFRVGYKQPAEGGWYAFDLIIDLYFYIDIVFNFCTGFVDPSDEERVIYHPGVIAKNYAKTWLAIDVVACLPIDIVLRITENRLICSMSKDGCPAEDREGDSSGQLLRLFKLLRLFRLMKLLRLFKIMRLFERYQDDLFKYLHYLSVLRLVAIMLYMGHLFGCFFHYFSVEDWRTPDENAQILDGTLTPWLKEYFQDGIPSARDVVDRYIASIYWAFTTMTTVGYGDISAVTRMERVIACFGMIVGGFVFSAIISTMSDVMAKTDLSKKAHAQKMESVSAFIRDANLPQEYLKEALAFFRKQKVEGYNRTAILNDLPYHLRRKILYHTYSHVISKVPLFDVTGDGENDDVFVVELCSRLRPVSYVSGQLIYQMGEIGRHMYILAVGRVEVLDKNLETVLTRLAPGAYFGEGCILGDVRRRENLRAQGHVEVCQLLSHDIDVLLDTYPHLQRALSEAYLKRKALFKRYEEARAVNPLLSLKVFVSTEMSRNAPASGQVSDDGQETDWLVKTDQVNQGKRKSLRALPEMEPESTDAAAPATDAEGATTTPGKANQSVGDPTLDFELTEDDLAQSKQMATLTRGPSGKIDTLAMRKLELRLEEMTGKQKAMEMKLEATLATVTRIEELLMKGIV
jgi:CRP-like cAMP-binding protein